MVELAQPATHRAYQLPDSFDAWRIRARQSAAIPVIAVAGSRGKSTVIRIVDAMLRSAGLRTATWTNTGIEINGRHQRGELVPWSRALSRLAEGRLDVAIQELDWSTVNAVGLPEGVYPVVAITNVCVNNEECLIHDEARRAMRSLPSLLGAVHPAGVAVLNGEDYALAGADVPFRSPAILVAPSPETPLVRGHLRNGGSAAWINARGIALGLHEEYTHLGDPRELGLTLQGKASFQVVNAMVAASIASAVGIAPLTINSALSELSLEPSVLPGSFNVFRQNETIIVVDRPDPSWFLRPVLRGVRDVRRNRLLTVVGRMQNAPLDDLAEVGRLLGRASAAVILHSQEDEPDRAERFRQGVASNDVPSVIVHTTTERRAINRALKMAREGDAVLILADQATSAVRQVQRLTTDSLADGASDGD
ncbi:MAG: glutamate ligase domain-containing protein [Thermomicrobiales bacterium]